MSSTGEISRRWHFLTLEAFEPRLRGNVWHVASKYLVGPKSAILYGEIDFWGSKPSDSHRDFFRKWIGSRGILIELVLQSSITCGDFFKIISIFKLQRQARVLIKIIYCPNLQYKTNVQRRYLIHPRNNYKAQLNNNNNNLFHTGSISFSAKFKFHRSLQFLGVKISGLASRQMTSDGFPELNRFNFSVQWNSFESCHEHLTQTENWNFRNSFESCHEHLTQTENWNFRKGKAIVCEYKLLPPTLGFLTQRRKQTILKICFF